MFAIPYIIITLVFILIFAVVTVTAMILTVTKRKKLIVAIPMGLVSIVMISFAFWCYVRVRNNHETMAKAFLGDYKLQRLDGKECNECKVVLHDSYRYDIIVKGVKSGTGDWDIGSSIDIPGYYLKLEHGPSIVWESYRTIEYIYRQDD